MSGLSVALATAAAADFISGSAEFELAMVKRRLDRSETSGLDRRRLERVRN